MRPIDVLVVDDSALVRQTLVKILDAASGFTVSVAADPLIAERRMETRVPDVIVLDIEMPGMDGLTFLSRLQASGRPIPVVICSARAGEDAGIALEALARGAVDVIAKPRLAVRDYFEETAARVTDAVRAAALSKKAAGSAAPPTPTQPNPPMTTPPLATRAATPVVTPAKAPGPAGPTPAPIPNRAFDAPLIAIGASTGGTEAIRVVLQGLPPNAPPVVIVQHMPEGFTAAFARRLNDLCALSVKEAEAGDVLRSGLALLAPGGRAHMRVDRAPGGALSIRLDEGPPINRHRPSADALFESVAVLAPGAVAAILTGMGRDGAAGLLAMRRAGAHTIGQDESTSIVFGMPREAALIGAVVEVLPLDQVAAGLVRAAARA